MTVGAGCSGCAPLGGWRYCGRGALVETWRVAAGLVAVDTGGIEGWEVP